jgi:hypothetical protein
MMIAAVTGPSPRIEVSDVFDAATAVRIAQQTSLGFAADLAEGSPTDSGRCR